MHRWAPVYDLVFGARVRARAARPRSRPPNAIGGRDPRSRRRHRHLAAATIRRSSRIFGIDISEPMLRKAQERVAELGLNNVEGLAVMDAEKLTFPDDSFDVVVAQYVVTAVPNPEATLDEFARVLKPGGEIMLVSRVSAEAGLRRAARAVVAPVARQLGWRTGILLVERYARWAGGHAACELVERRPMPPLGHFSLIRFRKVGGRRRARGTSRHAPRSDAHPRRLRSRVAWQLPGCHIGLHRIARNTDRTRTRRRSMDRISARPCERSAGTTIATIITAASISRCTSSARSASCSPMCMMFFGSGGGGAGRLAGGDDHAAGRSLLLRAEGLRHVNQATHEHKEEIKVGYNLQRKVVLMTIWALSPLPLYFDPTLFGLFEPHADASEFMRHVAKIWLVVGIGGLLFRTVQLFFIQDVQTGLVWATKILTDPFHDIKLYHKAPLYLMRGELIDPRPRTHVKHA